MRVFLRVITALSIVAASLVSVQPASAVATWVTGISWSNLHVKSEVGVFERYKREFDANSVLQTQSETQHNQAWVRTDRDSVTVTYTGKAVNGNKMVRFTLDGDQTFTYSTTNTVVSAANLENLPADLDVMTDAQGNAQVTMTLTETNEANRADSVLRAGISDGTTKVGNMVLLFEPAGYYPVIKLIGTGTGPEATCNTLHVFECNDADLDEKTWAWSVFKKDWLPEYSQVFVKSYVAGSTINLVYKVTDIWSTPISDLPITLNLDPLCRLCKWSNSFVGTKNTDVDGRVKFSLKNLNSTAEVKANSFVNSDTKQRETGNVAFALLPTSNSLQESFDEFWPQLVSDINIKPTATQITTLNRGGITADNKGNVTVGSGAEAKVNPPLVIDQSDSVMTDSNIINLYIGYVKNSLPIVLYAPDIKVTATNGGKFALITPSKPASSYAASTSQVSSYTFGYTYPQQMVVTCTRPGTTKFVIETGTSKHEYAMDCVLPDHSASQVVAVANGQVAVPSSPSKVQFKVTDRYGNGISGVNVAVSSAGNGSISGATEFVSDAAGIVSVNVTSAASGDQTLTATASDALATFTSATTTSVVRWGATLVTGAASKGLVKLTMLNLKGKTATVYEGKTKIASVKMTKATQVQSIKMKKGAHKLTIKVGSSSWNVSATVL